MASEFAGNAVAIRQASVAAVAALCGLRTDAANGPLARALSDLSLVLGLIPGLERWSETDRRKIAGIIRAKAYADESKYLRLLQRHDRLQAEVIRLGSRNA